MELLPIHSFLFNSTEFKVYGTHEEPLFLVNDVVCGLLGMKKIHNNQFFTDNREIKDYVMMLEIPACPPDLQQRLKNSNRDHIYFFTEKGLYKCLMRSNKPIAESFQDEICDHLKNIRLGNISIHINRIEEMTNQLAEQKERSERLIAEIQQHLNSATSELETANKKLEKATQKLSIYEIKIGDNVYRGRSKDPQNRIKQHMSNSSNPSIREAVRNGEHIETRILGTFDVITRADADHIERQYIEEIPQEVRLNRVLPHANADEIVINNVHEASVPEQPAEPIDTNDLNEAGIQEEVKEHVVLDDLDSIIEMTELETVAGESNVEMVVDKWFVDVIQKIKEFRQTHNRYPTDSIKSNTKDEQKLGVLCVKLRLGARLGKWFKMTPERLQYIQQELPDFAFDREAQLRWTQFTTTIDQIADRLARGLGYPKQVKNRSTDELKQERNLYEQLLRIQQQHQKGELTEDKLQYINEKIPDFAFGKRQDNIFNEHVQKLKEFGRLPTRNEDPKLYLFVSKTRVKIRDNELDAERIQLLKTECPFFA